MLVAYQGNTIQCGLYCKHFTWDLYFFKVSFRALSRFKLRQRVEFSISIKPSEKNTLISTWRENNNFLTSFFSGVELY